MQNNKDDKPESNNQKFKLLVEKLNEYDDIANIGEIARRSFGNNAFDGILTMIGVLIGSMASGVTDPNVVITTGLATSIAIMISGAWGAYLTETSERKKSLNELGRATLTDLNGSRIGRASRFAAVAVALVDGLAPFVGAILVLIPFFFSTAFPNISILYYTSLGAALLSLFALGLWLGYVAEDNLVKYGLKTLLAGLVSILIGSFLRN
jgi:predicted membrane protein (TIGR00267 family)